MKKIALLICLFTLVIVSCKKNNSDDQTDTSGTIHIIMTCNPGGFHAGYSEQTAIHNPVYVAGTSWEVNYTAKTGDSVGYHFTTNNSNATETISIFFRDAQIFSETHTGDSIVCVGSMTIR